MARILIIEDEAVLGKTCRDSLNDEGHDAQWLGTAEAGSQWLETHPMDLVLLDIGLPDANGMDFLQKIVGNFPDVGVIMMTARGDARTAVQAMKLGAKDYLTKPVDLDEVSTVVSLHFKQQRRAQTWKYEQRRSGQEFGLHQILGECPEIQQAKSMIRRISALGTTACGPPPNVMITGATGTGKDLFARAIHYEGARREGPFVQVNCATLPATLIESELFGHTRGAYTSAQTAKRGLFEVADQGSIFLDEIDTLELGLQAKILRAIETGLIRPVGGTDEISINVHLIAATNQCLDELIKQGLFRQDLFHRLRVINIHLPALCDRGQDILRIAEHFLVDFGRKLRMPSKELTARARHALLAYDWPGNVRELRNMLESAVLLSDETIDVNDLPFISLHRRNGKRSVEHDPFRLDFTGGPISLESVERAMIEQALSAARNNVSRAAELLAISRDTLRYRIEKFGLVFRRMENHDEPV